jgi:hypothetical protein
MRFRIAIAPETIPWWEISIKKADKMVIETLNPYPKSGVIMEVFE